MKDLRKTLTLAVVGIAMILGVFVLTSNAQRRGRSGISFSISYGQPYYRQHRSYRHYTRPTTYYVTRPYYGSGYYNSGYYSNGYYNNITTTAITTMAITTTGDTAVRDVMTATAIATATAITATPITATAAAIGSAS